LSYDGSAYPGSKAIGCSEDAAPGVPPSTLSPLERAAMIGELTWGNIDLGQ